MSFFSGTCVGEPVAKGRPKFVVRGKFATVYTPKKTRDFEELVRSWALSIMKIKKQKPTEKAVKVIIDAYFSRAKSNKKKHHTQKPDIDNMKSILDAMNGVVFVDDAQVIELKINKYWADYVNPSFTIVVYEVE